MAFKESNLNIATEEIIKMRHHFDAVTGNLEHSNPEQHNQLHALFDYEVDYAMKEVELIKVEYFMQRLINYDAKYGDKERLEALEARDIDGRSPMQLAMINGHKQGALKLITYGCDVNNKDKDGSTILHSAAASNIPMTVQEIIYKGGDVNAETKEGYTPLHLALYSRDKRTVDILVNYGSNLSEWKIKDESEPFLAAELGNMKLFTSIIRNVDINAKDREGNTALHYACIANNMDIAEAIIKRGGRLDIKNNTGKLAYQLADNATSDHVKIEKLKHQLDEAIQAKSERLKTNEAVSDNSRSM